MADGEAFSGSAEGDLTIKGVTNRVAFDLQAQLVGDRIVAVGSSDVLFSDYGVTAPTAPIVVSVEDHGIMEFQLLFTR
ncbi:MAG: YceI family protein [Acidimicrobiaceae bacterium]|nr:YceI family protein [Acidimicrobiaceae bacterium]